jgi:nicotinamidase-related amidase
MPASVHAITADVEAKPAPVPLDLTKTALIMIDMQRDFLEEGGFASSLGNDVSKVQRCIEPCQRVLEACRTANLMIIHTREGHRPSLRDVYAHKQRQTNNCIGSPGPCGRILIRGEADHDIIPQLYPKQGEPVIDKPGKGSFYSTDLELMLRAQQIQTLLVCGVTTEVCVHTTVREANDRGFHCVVIEDACASYMDEFHRVGIHMIWAQGGIFGSVATSQNLVQALKGGATNGSTNSDDSPSDPARN